MTTTLTLTILTLLTTAISVGSVSAQAEDRVYPNAESVQPLAPGSSIPSATMKTVRGEPIDLAAAMGQSGALLVFYRGGW